MARGVGGAKGGAQGGPRGGHGLQKQNRTRTFSLAPPPNCGFMREKRQVGD